ncbi:MAG: TetR family transcriptional regulator [Propionibacteriaceae bacterium]|nr:TetR family transcriptional regulator [Propionibacteriaceae bacterium]
MARPAAPIQPQALARLHLAAAQEFGALGLEHASLNRILAASGMAKSSFYHRYQGKRALYDELIARVHGVVERALSQLDSDVTSAEEFWGSACRAVAELEQAATDHPELATAAALLYRADAAAELSGLRRDLADKLRRRLAQGQQLGAVRTDLPLSLLTDLTVAMMLALDAWTLQRAGESGSDENRAAVASTLNVIRDLVSGD